MDQDPELYFFKMQSDMNMCREPSAHEQSQNLMALVSFILMKCQEANDIIFTFSHKMKVVTLLYYATLIVAVLFFLQ